MIWDSFDIVSASLCVWREARGEVATTGMDGIRAVLHVIDNRSKKNNKSWAQIVYQRLQFSSMTFPQDPQLVNVPKNTDTIFEDCYNTAVSVYMGTDVDITLGATHYFADSIPMPSWAVNMKFLVKIGHHSFYKE